MPKRISIPRTEVWLLAACLMPGSVLCASVSPTRAHSQLQSSLETHEQQVWRLPIHASEFADVPHSSAKNLCEQTQAPQALTTPNPILDNIDSELRIQVSFIVGTDGRVHSPLILQSAGTNESRTVLNTVRSWRYRPAMCNGVPTETEGKIQFSSR